MMSSSRTVRGRVRESRARAAFPSRPGRTLLATPSTGPARLAATSPPRPSGATWLRGTTPSAHRRLLEATRRRRPVRPRGTRTVRLALQPGARSTSSRRSPLCTGLNPRSCNTIWVRAGSAPRCARSTSPACCCCVVRTTFHGDGWLMRLDDTPSRKASAARTLRAGVGGTEPAGAERAARRLPIRSPFASIVLRHAERALAARGQVPEASTSTSGAGMVLRNGARQPPGPVLARLRHAPARRTETLAWRGTRRRPTASCTSPGVQMKSPHLGFAVPAIQTGRCAAGVI